MSFHDRQCIVEHLRARSNLRLGERDWSAVASNDRVPLDVCLAALGAGGEGPIAQALADAIGVLRYGAGAPADEMLLAQISPEFLRRRRVAPIRMEGDTIVVAVADPSDPRGIDGFRFATERPTAIVIATASEIESLVARDESRAPQDLQPSDIERDADQLRDLARAEPAVRQCAGLIARAATARASDIHIEPTERDYKVRFRIDGVLVEQTSMDRRLGLAVISRYKILSNLDIAERRRPQDGRFSHINAGQTLDLRVSTAPTVHGESLVMRLLGRETLAPDLEALGFSSKDSESLYRLSDRPNGIILLTGPTGSGKTTTLYALIRRLAERQLKILTIEDPVEYRIEGVSQTQANPTIGLDFAAGLRSFLRHDPDVIMVGEMRDLETARTAIQAALTGHLVLSTLHTNDAPSAIMRLLDMGVEDYLVASTLIGVVGQRLVRRVCGECHGIAAPIETCRQCSGAGFYGRIAINEVLIVDDALKQAVKHEPTSGELLRIARAAGFKSMRDDGHAKVAAGHTTEPELLRAIAEWA